MKEVNAAVIYWSKTGNTEKGALAIEGGLKKVKQDAANLLITISQTCPEVL